jgi:putative two-component system response regulator
MMQVVVVDDSSFNLTLMQHLINKLPDCEAKLFSESGAALDWCLAGQPDLVVVDYQMPEPDGLAFIERLRASPAHQDVPLLMITANVQAEIRYQALDMGANDFLTKPIDAHEFLARARNMLALRKSQLAVNDRAAWLAEEVNKATAAIQQREREIIMRLTLAAESRDPETGAHLLRMSHYSRLISATLGWSEEEQEMLLAAAPMHDIGKVGIPDRVLLKRDGLTPEELDIMRQHTRIGYDILADSAAPMLQMAAKIALTHHEKFDGTGYPSGLWHEETPLVGRIVAVADVFDALLSERPYKPAWPLDQTVDYMRERRGSHFDPMCLDAFFSNWSEVLAIRDRYRD